MKQYLDLVKDVLDNGIDQSDRTGVGTRNIFGAQLRFDLTGGFPLVTTKKTHFHSIKHELLWFLSGSTHNNDLDRHGVTIWREWAREDGTLGPTYGEQWRRFNDSPFVVGMGIDQIAKLIEGITTQPESRRHIVTAWDPSTVDACVLPPCHILFQMFVINGHLSCSVYQRSADLFLGVPFNIASYALLTHLVAQQCGLEVGDLVWSAGCVHLYHNHLEQAKLQLTREPRTLSLLDIGDKPKDIFSYESGSIQLIGYNPHPAIKAEVAV